MFTTLHLCFGSEENARCPQDWTIPYDVLGVFFLYVSVLIYGGTRKPCAPTLSDYPQGQYDPQSDPQRERLLKRQAGPM